MDLLPPADAGIERYRAWQDQRRRLLEKGGTPRLEVAIGTELEEPPPGFEAEIEAATISSVLLTD